MKNKAEWWWQNMANNNVFMLMSQAARGPKGQMSAMMTAQERYAEDNKLGWFRKATSTGVGMALDPVNYVGAGAGGGAAKVTQQAIKQVAVKQATKQAMKRGLVLTPAAKGIIGKQALKRTGAKIASGASSGAAFMATFEGATNAANQLALYGEIDPLTGEQYGFSIGQVGEAALHGAAVGAGMGVAGGVIGGVADKAVMATGSTAGKIGIRVGQHIVSPIAETTVFATSQYLDPNNEMDFWDCMKESGQFIVGLKAVHLPQTIGRAVGLGRYVMNGGETRRVTVGERILELRGVSTLEERLRTVLDGMEGSEGLNRDELAELQRAGYGDLAELFGKRPTGGEQKKGKRDSEGKGIDFVRGEVVDSGNEAQYLGAEGYDRLAEVMEDGRVSQATRARLYSMVEPNRRLPMMTITGKRVTEGEHGEIIVETLAANGEVVTSRTFRHRKDADIEIVKVDRQLELNAVGDGEAQAERMGKGYIAAKMLKREDVGEPYITDGEITLAEKYNLPEEALVNIYGRYLAGENMSEAEREIAEGIEGRVKPIYDKSRLSVEAIRGDVEKGRLISIDEVLEMPRGERTELQQQMVDRYLRELYERVDNHLATQEGYREWHEAKRQAEAEQQRLLRGAEEAFDEGAAAMEEAIDSDTGGVGGIDAEKLEGIASRMRVAEEDMDAVFGEESEEMKAAADEDPVETYWSCETDAEREAVMEYMSARAAVIGANAAMAESVAEAKRERARQLDMLRYREHTDEGGTERGGIVKATLKVDDREVYLIEGEVAMHGDGSGVDVANSSEMVIIYDAEEGGYRTASAEDLLRVEPAEEYDAVVDREMSAIDEQWGQKQAVVDEALGVSQRNKGKETNREHGGNSENIKPIGRGVFGDIYDAFRGKVREAVNFLFNKKSGEAKGVFHRDEIGDIGLIWGDDGKGLQHIIQKHIIQHSDFNTVGEMLEAISDIVSDGDITIQKGGNWRIEKDGRRVVIAKNKDGNFVITAYDDSRSVSEKRRNSVDATLFDQRVQKEMDGALVPSDETSVGKGSEKVGKNDERGENIGENGQEITEKGTINENQEGSQINKNKGTKEGEGQIGDGELGIGDGMPMRRVRDKKGNEWEEADYMAVAPGRSRRYIYDESGLSREEADAHVEANLTEAQKALTAHEKKEPKMGVSIPKYKLEHGAWESERNELQGAVDYWNNVKELQAAKERGERQAEERRRAEEQARLTEAALVEQQKEKEAIAQAKAEAEALGANNVAQSIKERWEGAKKIEGARSVYIMPDGRQLTGRYVLVEAGAVTASHDPFNGYRKTEGFPVDEHGQTVNDRDYERDKDAQRRVQGMADQYDARAIQSAVVVSRDGVVLSGNNRTMSGEIAAKAGTDKAYIDYLRDVDTTFTPEQVASMEHPRKVFVVDESMPYTTETFAAFNAPEQKSQNASERAVKIGKTLDNGAYGRIVRMIAQKESLKDFFGDKELVATVVGMLRDGGVITENELAQYYSNGELSDRGEILLEEVLVGKALEGNAEAVRQVNEMPTMRKRVAEALLQIADNRTLGDYSLSDELARAIDLAHKAKKADRDQYKEGNMISPFGAQKGLFDEVYGASDVRDAAVLMLADLLNHKRPTELRKVLESYNETARDAAGGQMDLLSGRPETKEEILKRHIDRYAEQTKQQREQQERDARAARQAAASGGEQIGDADGGGGEGGSRGELDTGDAGRLGGEVPDNDGRGNRGSDKARQSDLEQKSQRLNLSKETDHNELPLIISSNGTIDFGKVKVGDGYKPIRLSVGFDRVNEDGEHRGYGHDHIDAKHGEEIKAAGYASTLEFIEAVSKGYENIKIGTKRKNGSQTYIIEFVDEHSNMLYIEVTANEDCCLINSGGVFRPDYTKKNKSVDSIPATKTSTAAVEGVQEQGGSPLSGSAPSTDLFTGKGSERGGEKQGAEGEKYYGADNVPSAGELSAMSYDEAFELASRWGAKIAERYDNQIELLEAERDVIEDKWRKTSQEGKRLKAIAERIERLKANKEAEMQEASRKFNKSLQEHPERKAPLSMKDMWELQDEGRTKSEGRGKREGERDPDRALEREDFKEKPKKSEQRRESKTEKATFERMRGDLRDEISRLFGEGEDGKMTWAEAARRCVELFEGYAREHELPKGYRLWLQQCADAIGKSTGKNSAAFKRTKEYKSFVEGLKEMTDESLDAKIGDLEEVIWENDKMWRAQMGKELQRSILRGHESVAVPGDNMGILKAGQRLRIELEAAREEKARRDNAKQGELGFDKSEVRGQSDKVEGQGRMDVTEEMRRQEDELRKLLGIDDADIEGMKVEEPGELPKGVMRKVYSAGVEYAFNYLDNGVTSFDEFARAIVERLGDKVKPYVKSWYEGAKRVPGYGGEGYTPTEAVERYDMTTMQSGRGADPMEYARQRSMEKQVERSVPSIEQELKEMRESRAESQEAEQSEADRIIDEFVEEVDGLLGSMELMTDEEAAVADTAIDEAIDKSRSRLAEQLIMDGMDSFEAERVAGEQLRQTIAEVMSARSGRLSSERRGELLESLLPKEGEAYSPRRDKGKGTKEGGVGNEGKVNRYETESGEAVDYLSYGDMRQLKAGEVSYVERKFGRTGEFDFTGSDRVESADDVAYLFRELESYSTEHSFAVIIKGEKSYVIQLGMGNEVGTIISATAIKAASDAVGGADKVYFVHNHPSGVMKPSVQDQTVLRKIGAMLPQGVVQEGIIVDTLSGKYCVFGDTGNSETRQRPTTGGADKPIAVHRFNRHVFSPDYKDDAKIRDGADAAKLISALRLGQMQKQCVLMMNNNLVVTGSFVLDAQADATKMAEEAVALATRFGGRRMIFFGNKDMDGATWSKLRMEVERLSGGDMSALDKIVVTNGLRSEESVVEKKDAAEAEEREREVIGQSEEGAQNNKDKETNSEGLAQINKGKGTNNEISGQRNNDTNEQIEEHRGEGKQGRMDFGDEPQVPEVAGTDNQGNPIDGEGRLVVEQVRSIDEITDKDFTEPSRSILLPELEGNVADAIGAEGRRPMIKKNVLEKNRDSHKDLTADDSRRILNEVLYNPDLYGQNQKESRPYNWIMVHLADKNSAVVVEVNPTKEYLEIVNWHYLSGEALERKKRQAEREGGRILTLSNDKAAADTSQGLSSDGKGKKEIGKKQGGSQKNKGKEQTKEQIDKETNSQRNDGTKGQIEGLTQGGDKIIDDFGEKLEGARKDILGGIAKGMEDVTEESLIKLPLSEAFKRPNVKEAIEKGALTAEEAQIVEAMTLAVLSNKKPIVGRGRVNSYKAKRQAEEMAQWARAQKELIDRIATFINADESTRRAMAEKIMNTTEEGIVIKRGSMGMDGTMYDRSVMNPVNLMYYLLKGSGIEPGQKLSPIGLNVVKSGSGWYQMTGSSTMVRLGDSVDEALATLKTTFMLKNGAEGAQLPQRAFRVSATNFERVATGRYEVASMKGDNVASYKVAVFETKAEAEEYVKEMEGKGFTAQLKEQTQRKSSEFGIQVVDPIKHEYLPLEGRYGSKEEAMAAVNDDYEKINEEACRRIMENNKIKRVPKKVFEVVRFTSEGKEEWGVTTTDNSVYGNLISIHGSKAEAEAEMARLEAEYAELEKQRKGHVFFSTGVERRGDDWRKGQDATAQMYEEAFGFRGVQFGNWTNQRDRQEALNQAYDGLMDLARALGVPTRALSLGGELGIAFGARGSGSALAHYEPDTVVINLTKTKGEGTLAHEWWHALDNYFARRGGLKYGFATELRIEGMRPETAEAFKALRDAINRSAFGKRCGKRGAYWGSMREMTARMFEQWVDMQLTAGGEKSPFLSRGIDFGVVDKFKEVNWMRYQMRRATKNKYGREVKKMTKEEFMKSPEALEGYVYLTADEMKEFGGMMERLFKGLKMEDEEGKMHLAEPEGEYETGEIGIEYEMGAEERREMQYRMVTERNPMRDDYHTGIRSREDVKSFDEVLAQAQQMMDEYGELEYPDMDMGMLEEAKRSGRIKVYSSKPIEAGGFVTPSRMNAEDYAGGGKIYEKEVGVNDVAWIGADEGQYAPLSEGRGDLDVHYRDGEGKSEGSWEGRRETELPRIIKEEERYVEHPAEKVVINSVEDLKRLVLSEGYSEAEAEEAVKEYEADKGKEHRHAGGYDCETKKIVIFAESLSDERECRLTVQHEELHHQIDLTPRLRQAVEALAPKLKELEPALWRLIEKKYADIEPAERNEEMVVYSIEKAIRKNELDELHDKLSKVEQEHFVKLLNSIGYGKEIELLGQVQTRLRYERPSSNYSGNVRRSGRGFGRHRRNFNDELGGGEGRRAGLEGEMRQRVEELGEKLGERVRVVSGDELVDEQGRRRRRGAKGWYDEKTGEVTVVVDAHADVEDVENTFVHEVIGHKGLRKLMGAKFKEFIRGVYEHLTEGIKGTVDGMTRRKLKEIEDAIYERKRRERVKDSQTPGHENYGKDYRLFETIDRAAAKAEAYARREEVRDYMMEEYMADLAGKIGDKGFEKMSREELTLWGWIKRRVQRFLDGIFSGMGIRGKIRLTDKDLEYILFKSWKKSRKEATKEQIDKGTNNEIGSQRNNETKEQNEGLTRDGGRGQRDKGKGTNTGDGEWSVFDEAEDRAMRERTGYSKESKSISEKRSRIDKLRKSNPVDISGEEIEYSPDIKEFKKNAIEYGKTLQSVYINNDTGKSIQLQRGRRNGGLKEVLQHDLSDKAHIQSVAAIPGIIRDSIYIETEDNRDIEKNPDVTGYEHYVCGLRIGDEDYTVHSIVASDKQGNRYYDHKLSHIEKGKLLDFIEAKQPIGKFLTPMSGTKPTNRSERKIKELISLLQVNEEDDFLMVHERDMELEDYITRAKAEAMKANGDDAQAKRDGMRAIGGRLSELRKAMSLQRRYDRGTVKSITDLARTMMDANLLTDLSKMEVKRLLATARDVNGREDTSGQVQRLMDIMVDNQLRQGANEWGKLLKIKGSRVNAKGIEVQGELDAEGAMMAKVVKKASGMSADELQAAIDDAMNRMGDADAAIAENAAIEYVGLAIAKLYVEEIAGSKAEETALRDELKRAKEDKDAGRMDATAYKQFVEATQEAIRQNKIERAEAYADLVEDLCEYFVESIEGAKAWREGEKQRVNDIHYLANSDMQGRRTDEHHKEDKDKLQKLANNALVRFVMAPLGTFEQMLRMFGSKSARGEGYLWNHYMRGWTEATEKEYKGYRNALKELDAKVSEVFGKKMEWGDLFAIDRKLPKSTVRFMDGGEMKEHVLTQGNLMYIYMVDKMADGRMKLRKMGITEGDVEEIRRTLDGRFKQLADWLQEEYLTDKRNEYNEVHKRIFGAPMAAIENYFPLKILANARTEEVDVEAGGADGSTPTTSTGSIIKRRRNGLALDITGANALNVILDHLQEMERWAAFAEFNRDLNTLLSYKRFRNQVLNMTSPAYGAGETLWKNFKNVASMAAGTYRPPIAMLDKSAVNVAKGVTAAKVSFRIFTALKQLLSAPAYIADSNPLYLAKNLANPIGAWRWAMKNLPIFEKRWQSRMAGDPRLMKTDMDWKMWRGRVVELASRVGMAPNAFVDALTVSIGAKAMHETKLAKYKRYGYSDAEAEKRAKQDATIQFNQTQQSSEGAFLSTMQVDRSWLSVMFTVFRNASMSYMRQEYDAMRNLARRLKPGNYEESVGFMAKQMEREGIEAGRAIKNAKQEYNRGVVRDVVRIGVFGYILQLAWNLGAYLPYLILGDDDEEKAKMWEDANRHAWFGSIEGMTGGDVMSQALNMAAGAEGNWTNLTKDMPIAADLANIYKKMGKDNAAALTDVINLLVQSGVGVNPQSITDAVVAVMDYCDEPDTQRECALLIARVLNCPQSQLDKVYFDELGASGMEAKEMSVEEMAERYAEYKMLREAPLTGWMRSAEEADSIKGKKMQKVEKLAKDRIAGGLSTEELRSIMAEYDEAEKELKAINERIRVAREAEDWDAVGEATIEKAQYGRYRIMQRRVKQYKKDMKELTKQFMECKDGDERQELSRMMIGCRDKLIEDVEPYRNWRGQ